MLKIKREKNILSMILWPMIFALTVQMIFLAGTLFFGRTLSALKLNAEEVLNQQVVNRGNYLLMDRIRDWMDMEEISNTVDAALLARIADGRLTVEDLNSGGDGVSDFLDELVPELIKTMYSKRVSGIFLVLNTQDLDGEQCPDSLQGVYLRDRSPLASAPTMSTDILMERAPVAVVQHGMVSTDVSWQPAFDRENDPDQFYYYSFQTAYMDGGSMESRFYGYWTREPYRLSQDLDYAISYSIPLILEDGTVYGVIGVDILESYLHTLLPVGELSEDHNASYFLAMAEDEGAALDPVLISSEAITLEGLEELSFSFQDENRTEAADASGNYYAAAMPFEVYANNAPFSADRWYLVGACPTDTLYASVDQMQQAFVFSCVVAAAVGLACILGVSFRLSSPIRRLSQRVKEARKEDKIPDLPRTGIAEIDQFSDAIISLSREIEGERDTDPLTGLYGRLAFQRETDRIFMYPEKLKCAAILMMDLDKLKSANDTYGHNIGDRYIQTAGRCFKKNVPPETLCARISGDEFVLLFYGYDNQEDIRERIEELLQAIQQEPMLLPNGEDMGIKVSGGIAWYPQDADNLSDLLKLADFAMYQVKRSGRGKVNEFDLAAYNENLIYEQCKVEFQQLLQTWEVDYHFQPIFSAYTGKPFGYEALMRLNFPTLRSPVTVLDIAKETHSLQQVEQMTLYRAAECFEKLMGRQAALEDTLLFVNSIANVSMSEEREREFIRQFGHLKERLVLEITEVEDLDIEVLQRKRQCLGGGNMMALDDYGSGYNTEINLLTIDPRFIKVDITIVRDVDTNEDKQQIISNIVSYAHQRGMLIIAEGIETAEETKKVLELGVDLLQGYFLSRPAAHPSEISEAAAQVIRDFCVEES